MVLVGGHEVLHNLRTQCILGAVAFVPGKHFASCVAVYGFKSRSETSKCIMPEISFSAEIESGILLEAAQIDNLFGAWTIRKGVAGDHVETNRMIDALDSERITEFAVNVVEARFLCVQFRGLVVLVGACHQMSDLIDHKVISNGEKPYQSWTQQSRTQRTAPKIVL